MSSVILRASTLDKVPIWLDVPVGPTFARQSAF